MYQEVYHYTVVHVCVCVCVCEREREVTGCHSTTTQMVLFLCIATAGCYIREPTIIQLLPYIDYNSLPWSPSKFKAVNPVSMLLSLYYNYSTYCIKFSLSVKQYHYTTRGGNSKLSVPLSVMETALC